MSSNKAELTVDGKTYELPIITGTEGERAIDIERERAKARERAAEQSKRLELDVDDDATQP